MSLINEQVSHSVFGIGRVISLDDSIMAIQFSEKTVLNKFVYPDAFEKHLTMCNPAVAENVLADLRFKIEQIEAEKVLKQQQYEEEVKQIALEKAELAAQKKKKPKKVK